MRNLTQGHTTHRRRDDIVDSGRVFFAEEFPHQRTAQCIRSRLPEVHAVGTGHIEVEIAVIRVRKHVHDEDVVVPHKTCTQVVADGVHRCLGKILLGNKAIVELYAGVQCRYGCCGHPRMFFLRQGHDRVGADGRIGLLHRWLLGHRRQRHHKE